MKINICGIPHEIKEVEDRFDVDCHFGQINYKKAEILINKDSTDEIKEETICHEVLHGILVHLGYGEQANDEQFVQAVGNAIYNSFSLRANS